MLEHANNASALLLTADNDFGELVYREGRLNSGGVVLIRLAGLSAWGKAEITANAFRLRGIDFPDCFSIVAPGKIRVRQRG
ncbi:MAG TPA: DUF5615 family PIN-like protein [Pyrinomonadaceae bacterium]|nr:DUF5615 family PIN-like protein [Pyrinomonadaceae bacterium]